MVQFQKIHLDDAVELSAVASKVVKEHFDPIIGAAQNDYMIAKFQSVTAIQDQLKHGYQYYWMHFKGQKAGFCAFYPRNNKMYLSKFYILKEFRGQHLAHEMFDFIKKETENADLDTIFLNVNKDNTHVIAIYEHLGFQKVRCEKNDIGGGFYMDDYVLEYKCTSCS